MDQGNKEGLNSSKRKKMEKTSSDQKELDDEMEQARKRFKNTATPALLQEMRLLLAEETDSEKTETDKETSSDEETETETDQEEEEASVISPAGSSTNNPKGMKISKKRIREEEEEEEEKKSKSNSLLSDTCTSTLRMDSLLSDHPPGFKLMQKE